MIIRHQEKRVKVPTASTARKVIERKTCKRLLYHTVNRRVILTISGDNAAYADGINE